MSDTSTKDNIWLTAKTRMIAETRLRRYSIASHLSISYFSLLLVISSVLSQSLPNPPKQLDSISIVLAVSTLSLSLLLYGFSFSSKADQFRSSYLELQRLHHSFNDYKDPAVEYFNILDKYINHADRDFKSLIVLKTFFDNQNIYSGTHQYKYTMMMLVNLGLLWLGFWVLCLLPSAAISALMLLLFIW